MCLELKNAYVWPRIALWDIVCFKRVIKTDNFGTLKYYTPYQKEAVEIGSTYKSKIRKDGSLIDVGLHSYVTQKDAIANSWGNPIVKCIIPRGSIYYKGRFLYEPCYASNKITYVEFIGKDGFLETSNTK